MHLHMRLVGQCSKLTSTRAATACCPYRVLNPGKSWSQSGHRVVTEWSRLVSVHVDPVRRQSRQQTVVVGELEHSYTGIRAKLKFWCGAALDSEQCWAGL